MPLPDVTVITPVHDTRDYLGPWFSSLLDQTMARDRFEVIALNDGSTDGSAEVLDELALTYGELLRVVHLPPNGGPARPRNVGLELANGTYVFFLDSDDRLGPEALERMTAYADRHDSDVVLGRMAGINGRRVPRDVFRNNLKQADVASSGILYALTPAKLFRRELIERHRIRFRGDLIIGSDHPFVLESYLRARRISVLADYTCYYLVARDGGGNISLGPAVTSSLRLPYMRASAETVLRVDGPGAVLDALLRRVLRVEFTDLLGPGFTSLQPPEQCAELAALRAYLDEWYRPELSPSLPSWVRWRIHCVQEGKRAELCSLITTEKADGLGFRTDDSGSAAPVLVSEGRAYAQLPGFRDPAFGIPDSCYDITAELTVDHRLNEVALDRDGLTVAGTTGLPRLAGAPSAVEVFARERDTGVVLPLPTVHSDGGFRARWAVSELSRVGTWDLFATVCCAEVRREVRLGSSRDPGLTLPSPCYWTKPYGNLSLVVKAPYAAAAVPLPRSPARPAPRGLRRLWPGRTSPGARTRSDEP